MVWSGRRTGHSSGVGKNGDHSRRTAAIRFYLLSSRQFSAHPKSSLARIDKRTARATRNTRYRYNEIGPLDHKMADNCVSLARTNTLSSTITKLIKTWKTSNKSYSYNLVNRINKMYTHDLFYLQQEWEAWLAPRPVYKQIRTTKSQLTHITVTKGENYRRRLRPLLLWLCDVFWPLINSLVGWFCTCALFLVMFLI